ncbi:DUF2513 domain-containing protein [Paraglaciecola chathamensis]|uniref:DUF2513 domain-containing protein n=1 Tax=Paraglaciecola agarilytica NO2 TaxID=1125747 RepID=A0ABQ0I385_9ALTE|nr:DUF2513 domain-containing protein [Paraglaciecola agarilytica]GAC03799.1 hypothetical protein GAGA_0936 [Paraglaciecola agarilytica NO2]
MKIDIEYLARVLEIFTDSEEAHVYLCDVYKPLCGNEVDDKFLFHYALIVENGLVSRRDLTIGNFDKMGVSYSLDGSIFITNLPLRLTQNGLNFASALNNREVLNKLKIGFKEAPFKTLFEGSQQLLTHFFKKKIDSLTDE